MTYAPDPYATAGWTAQHQHRTTAEPPYLDLSELEQAALADPALMAAVAEAKTGENKPRRRGKDKLDR